MMPVPEISLGKYMIARLIETKPKTAVYNILSTHHGAKLGQIKWYGPWRQYVFESEPLTIFNRDCMLAICGFLQGFMDARKKEAKS